VLLELLRGTPLDDYSNVVTLLFQDASDAGENNVDTSGKDMVSYIHYYIVVQSKDYLIHTENLLVQ
jgi:hypothetical protein